MKLKFHLWRKVSRCDQAYFCSSHTVLASRTPIADRTGYEVRGRRSWRLVNSLFVRYRGLILRLAQRLVKRRYDGDRSIGFLAEFPMCGRFRQTRSQKQLEERFQAEGEVEVVPRFNIAPTDPLVTVRQEKGKASRRLSTMRWGLIPSWAKDMSYGNQTINARSETLTSKLSFSDSVRYRRCLIPADGFYEWKKSGKVRQPYLFEVGEGELFAFAGLWDEWKNPEGKIIKSCTILTTIPNTLLADIHDRMPVIVTPDQYDLWLNPEVEDFAAIHEILKPYDPSLMRHYPVSPRVNSVQNDDAECATPVTLELPEQARLF